MSDEKLEPKTKHGGKRPNSGRKKGTPNKATAEIKAIAQQYGEQAIATLASIMLEADSDTAKISAAKELLDRGYGKSTQAISGIDGAPLLPPVIQFVRDADTADA